MPPNLLFSILSSLQRADVVYLVVSRRNLNLKNSQLKKTQFNKQLWAMTYFLYRRAPFSNLKYLLLLFFYYFLAGIICLESLSVLQTHMPINWWVNRLHCDMISKKTTQ